MTGAPVPVKKCASWDNAQNGSNSCGILVADIDSSRPFAVAIALSIRVTPLQSAAVLLSFGFRPQALSDSITLSNYLEAQRGPLSALEKKPTDLTLKLVTFTTCSSTCMIC